MNELADYRRSGIDAPTEVLLGSAEWAPFVHFMNGWFRTPLSAATGVGIAELDELERECGRKFPASLREWYRLVGAHESFLDETGQDFEMPLSRIGESSRWVVIFGENQEAWHCGILNEHLGLANPPVHFESFSFDPVEDAGYDPAELVDDRFIPVTETVTEFVFGMALRQMVIRLDPSPFMRSGVSGALFGTGCDPDLVRSELGLMQMLDFPSGFNPEFTGSDLVMVEDWGFAARTVEVFEAVERIVASHGGSLRDAWRA